MGNVDRGELKTREYYGDAYVSLGIFGSSNPRRLLLCEFHGLPNPIVLMTSHGQSYMRISSDPDFVVCAPRPSGLH
uniref:Transducin/WD40 repeat-like superfamily protein n=1 Tax=Steinernema glaseri TaxID=37863 RepID=A0A1I8AGV8_9BILA